MFNVTGATAYPVLYDGGEITEELGLAPFTVYQGPSGAGHWVVKSGTLNDYVPEDVETEFAASSGMIYLKIGGGDIATYPTSVIVNKDASTPADSDDFGYITLAEITSATTVNQFVAGSLWSQRHKYPGNTAVYYYYRI